MLTHFRWFAIAAGCTGLLFGAAFWIPNSDVGAAAAIGSILVGLPITILLYRDGLRAAHAASAPEGGVPGVLTWPIRMLGSVCLLGGIAILAWLAYNLFVQHGPQFTGVRSIGQLVTPFLLIFFGYRWMWRPLAGPNEHSDPHPNIFP